MPSGQEVSIVVRWFFFVTSCHLFNHSLLHDGLDGVARLALKCARADRGGSYACGWVSMGELRYCFESASFLLSGQLWELPVNPRNSWRCFKTFHLHSFFFTCSLFVHNASMQGDNCSRHCHVCKLKRPSAYMYSNQIIYFSTLLTLKLAKNFKWLSLSVYEYSHSQSHLLFHNKVGAHSCPIRACMLLLTLSRLIMSGQTFCYHLFMDTITQAAQRYLSLKTLPISVSLVNMNPVQR